MTPEPEPMEQSNYMHDEDSDEEIDRIIQENRKLQGFTVEQNGQNFDPDLEDLYPQ